MILVKISHAVICIAYAGALAGLDKQIVSAAMMSAYAIIVWADCFGNGR
ncbi:hypothetical protein [Ahrensia sp. R2A130]|nr:hypothetical protein [Ahrensia sp. R2A130]EFL88400.1 hypothetical protein R2A130_2920 [Ahrensia sp. R2A130]